jgi:GAF domain-containing protein
MTFDRSRRVSEILRAALIQDEPARSTFLDEACGDDVELRSDVEALIGQDRESPSGVLADSSSPTIAPPSTRPGRRDPFVWVVAATTVVVVLAFGYAGWLLVTRGGASISYGWTGVPRGDDWFVDAVDAQGPAAGVLQRGDRILAIEGMRIVEVNQSAMLRPRLVPGETYEVTFDRNGSSQTVALGVIAGPPVLARRLAYFVSSLLWCAIGLWIGASRPEHAMARLAAAVSVAVGLVFLSVGVLERGTLWAPLHVVLGYHFFARFPTGAPTRGLWRALLWVLYATGSIAAAINLAFLALVSVGDWSVLAKFPQGLIRVAGAIGLPTFTGSIAGMVAVLPYNYRRLTTEDQRRRVRWVLYGGLIGLVPEVWYAVVATIEAIRGSAPVPRFELVANLVPVIIPICVAYAVVKHRVFDITVAIRLGVQYLLARRALQALVALPLIALAYTLVVNRHRTLAEIATESTGYIYWMAAAGVGLRFRRPIGAWLDRRFFREQYDREQLLVGLLDEVGGVDSIAELSRLVSEKLEQALHPKAKYLWYRDPHESAVASSSNPDLSPPDFPAGAWVSWLEAHAEASELPLPAAARVTDAERRWFALRRVRLVVPIMDSGDRLVGVLLLGDKKSEEPYTANDRRLLQAVAKQTAAARENLLLRAKVSEEQRIRHDVLARLGGAVSHLLKECPACGTCFEGEATHCSHDGQPLTLSLPISRTVDGKYRLDRLIGRGGMGAVYEARDLRLDRVVAVKILLGRAFGQQTALRRFHREARTAARLNHPNIVRVYDYGPLEGEGAYLVMERLEGVTMRAMIAQTKRLAPRDAVAWFDPLLRGLAAAHGEGIVHRDLKPENVIGQRVGARALNVTILDFGLAKLHTTDLLASGTLTVHGAVMGTLGYMSPEQLLGDEVDHRTDIFAVGVMIVEALTGQRPFQGATPADISRAVLRETSHLQRETCEAAALDELVQRCLAKDRSNRLSSAEELRGGLIPMLRALSERT